LVNILTRFCSLPKTYKKLKFHGKLTLEQFWTDWYGIGGRDLGSLVAHSFGSCPKGHPKSKRMFTDNIQTYLDFIEWCITNNYDCWISNQPMRTYNIPYALDKVFLDFDYPLKTNEEMTVEKKEEVKEEVKQFIDTNRLFEEPLLVETYKGYHIYLFLANPILIEPTSHHLKFASEVFGTLALQLAGIKGKVYNQLTEFHRDKWKFMDWKVAGDFHRLARVPLTPHPKTGELCYILNRDLEPTKIRGLDLYRTYGIREDKIRKAAETVKKYKVHKLEKEKRYVENGARQFLPHKVRPCFQERMDAGEMCHEQRLALRNELYWAGYKTEDELVEMFRCFNDFDEKYTHYQISYFLKHKVYPPWNCRTLQARGWCIKEKCGLYKP